MGNEINVISDTIQEFNGERFYLCGAYFQHHGKRLHRAVWEYHNGEIPEGYHIHHLDGCRANNEIDNLALLPGVGHLHNHMLTEERRTNSYKAIEIARKAASEWHGSAAGREWHSELAKRVWAEVTPRQKVCTYCGATYETRDLSNRENHFCSGKCRAAYGRKKRREGKVC